MTALSLEREGTIRGRRAQVLRLHDHMEGPPPQELFPSTVGAVYSDPPWNPGNATYWRTMAGLDRCESFARFWNGFLQTVKICLDLGARHVLIEQSAREEDQAPLLEAWARAFPDGEGLPFQARYNVRYQSGRRPNALLHWGVVGLIRDPSGLHGPEMTRRALLGCALPRGAWVVDPCTGLGMTSREAHALDLNFWGLELNPARLKRTEGWLRKKGYR